MNYLCFNPLCSRQSALPSPGSLYALETRSSTGAARRPRYFWLCPQCGGSFSLCLNTAGWPVLQPGAGADLNAAAHPMRKLRPVPPESIHPSSGARAAAVAAILHKPARPGGPSVRVQRDSGVHAPYRHLRADDDADLTVGRSLVSRLAALNLSGDPRSAPPAPARTPAPRPESLPLSTDVAVLDREHPLAHDEAERDDIAVPSD